MLTRGAHDERAGDIYTAAGANVGEMGDDMGVRSNYDKSFHTCTRHVLFLSVQMIGVSSHAIYQ